MALRHEKNVTAFQAAELISNSGSASLDIPLNMPPLTGLVGRSKSSSYQRALARSTPTRRRRCSSRGGLCRVATRWCTGRTA